jgi:HAD superfamily hydrolase (TIGR01484 family)
MKYKALMLDLDGTTIPNKRDGMPSEKVRDAVAKANKKLFVGIVTGRPYFWVKEIAKSLELSGPSIVSGGAQIVDGISHKVLWQKIIPHETMVSFCHLLEKNSYPFLLQSFDSDIIKSQHLNFSSIPNSILLTVPELLSKQADKLIEEMNGYTDIALHKMVGWNDGTEWIHMTHIEATKQYAIFEVAKILGIKTHEIIGVGDGYNDFPLLMACGLKVAMGNAVEDLKAIADYIAPSVEEDGVADVIEKFILEA